MNNTFSANMLKTFIECPRKYFLKYAENIQIPQSSKSAETGKNIHALINYYFNKFDTTKLVEALNPAEKILWQNFLELGIKPENVYKSEYTFNVKTDKSDWLTGRIDAIIKEKNKYIIYDWKTGNIPNNPEDDIQTCIYLFSIYKILKSKKLIFSTEDISFLYTNLKTKEKIKIKIDKEKYNDLKNNILSIIEETKSTIAFNNSTQKKQKLKENEILKNAQCKNCKYKTIC